MARDCSESESVFERKMEELDGSSRSVSWKRLEDDEWRPTVRSLLFFTILQQFSNSSWRAKKKKTLVTHRIVMGLLIRMGEWLFTGTRSCNYGWNFELLKLFCSCFRLETRTVIVNLLSFFPSFFLLRLTAISSSFEMCHSWNSWP